MNRIVKHVRHANGALQMVATRSMSYFRDAGSAVAKTIFFRSVFPRTIAQKRKGKGVFNALRDKFDQISASRMSLRDQTFFAKRLSFLISAGVPIVECLHMLREQARSRGHSLMLERIIADTSNGQSLAKSFSRFPKIFSEFSVHIIRVGESSGTLSQNLNHLSNELKKRQTLRRKVAGAFVYPAVVTVATLGITAFLMVYLFPKITPIFSSLHTSLPFTTRTVMAVSVFLRDHGLELLFGILLFSALCAVAIQRVSAVRFLFHTFLLRLPAFGIVIKYYNVANASRTLGLLLRSGLTLSEALPITADTTANLTYRAQFERLSSSVLGGEKISTYLRGRRDLFPDIFGNMVAVGEKSGSLAETLVYLSELYEAEVDDFSKNLSTLVEPALMIFMGLLVGFIAVSIITPIYGITSSLHT